MELDAAGCVWFYEVRRYDVVLDGRTASYTPDFWIVEGTQTDVPSDVDAREYVSTHAHVVEDVKGWWKPTHKTYRKVMAFQEQHPEVHFQIVVREGQ